MTTLIEYIGLGELLAICAAMSFAVAQIFIRLGMQSATTLMAALIINTWVSLGGLVISLHRGTLQTSTWEPILWYMAVGVAGPGIGRIAYLIGINRMGLNRSVTISSCAPLWSTLIAVVLLAERPSAWVIVGTVAIVAGVALLSIQEDRSQSFQSWLQGALIFPLVASVGYALPPIFSKMAYTYQTTPAVGMTVAFFMANVVLLAFKPLMPVMGKFRVDRKGFLMLCASGALSVLSSFCLWTAISISSVSTTLPLSRTAPIYVLILSHFFLGKLEAITPRIVIGGVSVVIGGVLITALR